MCFRFSSSHTHFESKSYHSTPKSTLTQSYSYVQHPLSTKHSDFSPFYAGDPIVTATVLYANYSFLRTFSIYLMFTLIYDCSSTLFCFALKHPQSNIFITRNVAQAITIFKVDC